MYTRKVLCVRCYALRICQVSECIGAAKRLMFSKLPYAYTLSGYAFGCVMREVLRYTHEPKACGHRVHGLRVCVPGARVGAGARGGNPRYIYVYAFCLITYMYSIFILYSNLCINITPPPFWETVSLKTNRGGAM